MRRELGEHGWIEATAIIRGMLGDFGETMIAPARRGARRWLAENTPPTDVYMGVVRGILDPDEGGTDG